MKLTTDFRHWGCSFTRLTKSSILASISVTRILVIGPFALGWTTKGEK